jgi:hypothetical protein
MNALHTGEPEATIVSHAIKTPIMPSPGRDVNAFAA